MDRPVELVPLLCLRCSYPIPAQVEEVGWVCTQCGQGNLLDEARGLIPLEIYYSAALAPQASGKPYWTVDGRVLVQRDTYKGSQLKESEKFWAQPRRFCIPAFQCTLDLLLTQGKQMLFQPPILQPGSPAPFLPVVLPFQDVRASVEFLIMAVEAERKDMLRNLSFEVDLQPPVLWVLP